MVCLAWESHTARVSMSNLIPCIVSHKQMHTSSCVIALAHSSEPNYLQRPGQAETCARTGWKTNWLARSHSNALGGSIGWLAKAFSAILELRSLLLKMIMIIIIIIFIIICWLDCSVFTAHRARNSYWSVSIVFFGAAHLLHLTQWSASNALLMCLHWETQKQAVISSPDCSFAAQC